MLAHGPQKHLKHRTETFNDFWRYFYRPNALTDAKLTVDTTKKTTLLYLVIKSQHYQVIRSKNISVTDRG